MFQKCFGIVGLGLACCGALRGEITPPAVVLEKATFWVDASQLTVGTELTSWPDARGGSYPVASSYTSVKPKVISVAAGPLAGKPAVDFYPIGTSCDMGFDMQYVRTVFLVVDIDRSMDAFWLACHTDSSSNSYYLHRGNNGAYQLSNANVNGCAYYNDGYQVLSPTSTIVPTGYQLVTWSRSAEGRIDGFTNDRNISGRIGGKRLCEAILFRDQLSLVQQARVEAYLRAKWFGEAAMAGLTLTFPVMMLMATRSKRSPYGTFETLESQMRMSKPSSAGVSAASIVAVSGASRNDIVRNGNSIL